MAEKELTMFENEDAGEFYRRQIRHRDTVAYKMVSLLFGFFFFLGSIIFFFMDAQKYLFPILFYDIVGTVMLVYGLSLSDLENKKKKEQDKKEEFKRKVRDKHYDLQV